MPHGSDPSVGIDPDFLLDDELDDERREVLQRHARAIAAGADPDTPLTAAHAFRPGAAMTPAQGLGLLAAAALVLLSGFAAGPLVEWLGVRSAAVLLLAMAAAAAWGLGSAVSTHGKTLSLAERALLIGTLLFATVSQSALALALVPAVVHAAVARVMFGSLGDGRTIIEIGARLSHPLAPAFIGPYCRKLTVVWGSLFASSAVITAMLALAGADAMHRTWTGWLFWTLLGAFSAVEFFWRKAWFRYYGRGPLDRFLARLFPAERTERGRRSQAYLMRMRSELARLAEAERVRARR